MLTLKRASKHRTGGPWDDYDVYDGERHIGRIMLHPQAPPGEPWFWANARFPNTMHDRGDAASREQAMAQFKAAWERDECLLCRAPFSRRVLIASSRVRWSSV